MGEKEAVGVPDPETLQKRYQELLRLTANGIVAHGSGECDYAAFKNCLERQKKHEKKDAAAKKKKDAASTAHQQAVEKAKKKLADNNNKESCLTVPELKTLCKFYKEKGDKRIPTKRDDLLARFWQYMRKNNSQAPNTASASTHTSRAQRAAKDQTDSQSDHESESSDEGTSDEESQESFDDDKSGRDKYGDEYGNDESGRDDSDYDK
jgi:hypothetical protein